MGALAPLAPAPMKRLILTGSETPTIRIEGTVIVSRTSDFLRMSHKTDTKEHASTPGISPGHTDRDGSETKTVCRLPTSPFLFLE